MKFLSTPIERQRSFTPKHCPWPECDEHLRHTSGYRFRRHGTFATSRRRSIPRFVCLSCGRTFSRQTFSVTYYRKRPELIEPIAAGLVAGSAFRQLARSLRCAPTTVGRISALLGRHATLFNANVAARLRGRLSEPVALDHFETFEARQDYPFGVATAVGAESWFVYALDPAPHRGNRQTSARRNRKLRLAPRREHHGQYVGSVQRVLDSISPMLPAGEPLELLSDGHPHYRLAIRRHPLKQSVRHSAIRNPPSTSRTPAQIRRAAQRNEAMFSVDLLHKIFRHSMAHHRRETIAFSRRINAAMERFALVATWRNFVKRHTERRKCDSTPAMHLKLTDQPWDWRRVLARRLFYFRQKVPAPWAELYRREWSTPLWPHNSLHLLSRNF